ncbi:MAG TPA: gluconokinase [Rhodanobacter sp.]|nr:gluconokinase [Rhodanobacter sp.]
MIVVVMGVSGSGKSTLGRALADALGCDFQEGDDLHPQANIDKMRAGQPLDDADRGPWLEHVGAWMADEWQARRAGVISCSALKRSYRDTLRRACRSVRFVFLQLPRSELLRRLQRREHFMPASLLDSQLQVLEQPQDEPDVLTVAGADDLACVLAEVRDWLTSVTAPPRQ